MIMSGEMLGKLLAVSQIKPAEARDVLQADLDDDEKKVLKKIKICRESFSDTKKRNKVLDNVSQTLYTTNLPLPEALMSFFVALLMEPAPEECLENMPCDQLFKLLNSSFEFFELYSTILRSYYRVTQTVI